jgi:hypothetical protein
MPQLLRESHRGRGQAARSQLEWYGSRAIDDRERHKQLKAVRLRGARHGLTVGERVRSMGILHRALFFEDATGAEYRLATEVHAPWW